MRSLSYPLHVCILAKQCALGNMDRITNQHHLMKMLVTDLIEGRSRLEQNKLSSDGRPVSIFLTRIVFSERCTIAKFKYSYMTMNRTTVADFFLNHAS